MVQWLCGRFAGVTLMHNAIRAVKSLCPRYDSLNCDHVDKDCHTSLKFSSRLHPIFDMFTLEQRGKLQDLSIADSKRLS